MTQQQMKENHAFDADAFVSDFLTDNPNFFNNRIDLLTQLSVPHPCGHSVSLIERQITALRSDNKKLSAQLHNMINIAKENDQVHQQIDHLTLTLFEAKTLDQVFEILRDSLQQDFQADQIALKFFTTDHSLIGKDYFYQEDDDGVEHFEYFLKAATPSCGRLNPQQKQYLFDAHAEKIQSCALIPLHHCCANGLLAIGSYDEKRYHPGRGTTFLKHLSQLLSKVIQVHAQQSAA